MIGRLSLRIIRCVFDPCHGACRLLLPSSPLSRLRSVRDRRLGAAADIIECTLSLSIQLVPLPRTPSVKDILSDYEAATTSSSSTSSRQHTSRSASLTHEIVSGLKLYFEKSIGNNLLYRFERGQYGEIKKKYQGPNIPAEERKEMIEIYGVEHLLRLFGELFFSRFRRGNSRRYTDELEAHTADWTTYLLLFISFPFPCRFNASLNSQSAGAYRTHRHGHRYNRRAT